MKTTDNSGKPLKAINYTLVYLVKSIIDHNYNIVSQKELY
jgi:hypothetical protein